MENPEKRTIVPPLPQEGLLPYAPTQEEVDELIARARAHPLGIDFLKVGAPEAITAIFGVHAFLVDQARTRLQEGC